MGEIKSNLHTHTVFSDGTSTAEEYVLAALDRGFLSLGFSEHAWAPYDGDCCIKRQDIPAYFAEIDRLRALYGDQVRLYTAFESDYYQPLSREGLDYVIGSAHYMRDEKTGEYYTIDYLPVTFEQAVSRVAGGDIRLLVARYFEMMAWIAREQRPEILGHVDLITKLNTGNQYFDEGSGWYLDLLDGLAGEIARSGVIVEVNTGGMFRGYTLRPYPGEQLLRRLHSLGVPVTISSDAHCAEGLDYRFDEMADLLQRIGYTGTVQLVDGRFVPVPFATAIG